MTAQDDSMHDRSSASDAAPDDRSSASAAAPYGATEEQWSGEEWASWLQLCMQDCSGDH
jgi:hypothetical protein